MSQIHRKEKRNSFLHSSCTVSFWNCNKNEEEIGHTNSTDGQVLSSRMDNAEA